MDSMQTQVSLLTNKIDALHHMIDQVNDQVAALIATQACSVTPGEPGISRFAYGNAHIENVRVTRAMVDEAATKLGKAR